MAENNLKFKIIQYRYTTNVQKNINLHMKHVTMANFSNMVEQCKQLPKVSTLWQTSGLIDKDIIIFFYIKS